MNKSGNGTLKEFGQVSCVLQSLSQIFVDDMHSCQKFRYFVMKLVKFSALGTVRRCHSLDMSYFLAIRLLIE